MRVFGYCRVSGAEQGKHGTSLDAQQQAIRSYCKVHELPAPELFVEVESGAAEKVERRVELRRLLDRAGEGDAILVTRADRWSRDLVHAVASVRELTARGIRWVAIQDAIDASTAQGNSTLGIMAWVADQERTRIRERTVGRRKGLRDEGYFVEGSAPTGYLWEGRTLRPDPDMVPAVRRMFELACQGRSLRRIGVVMRAEFGEQGWDPSGINVKLRARYVLGEVQDSAGNWIKGRHEAIVDRDVWAAANRQIDSRRSSGGRRQRVTQWIMGDIARCGVCGDKLGYHSARDRTGTRQYPYLRCFRKARNRKELDKLTPGPPLPDCSAKYARADLVAERLVEMSAARLGELAEALAAAVEDDTQKAPPAPAEAHRSKIAARRSGMIDLAADGAITRAELRAKLAVLDAELMALDAELREHRRRLAAARPEGRRELLRSVKAIHRAWRRAKPEQLREVFAWLAHDVAIVRGEDPVVRWRSVEELASP